MTRYWRAKLGVAAVMLMACTGEIGGVDEARSKVQTAYSFEDCVKDAWDKCQNDPIASNLKDLLNMGLKGTKIPGPGTASCMATMMGACQNFNTCGNGEPQLSDTGDVCPQGANDQPKNDGSGGAGGDPSGGSGAGGDDTGGSGAGGDDSGATSGGDDSSSSGGGWEDCDYPPCDDGGGEDGGGEDGGGDDWY